MTAVLLNEGVPLELELRRVFTKGPNERRSDLAGLAEAGYRAAIGGTVAVPCTRHAADRSAAVPEHERRRNRRGHHYRPVPYPPALRGALADALRGAGLPEG